MADRHRKLTYLGIAFIFLAGSAWHFLFEWLGYWRPIAWLAPVNESVWEHLKMTFWPGMLWAGLEARLLRQKPSAFWLAKACGLLLMPAIIAGVFYSYTAILGRFYLPIDILSFFLAIVAGQLLSYRLATRLEGGQRAQGLGLAIIALMALAFVVFTYAPPHIFLFKDGPTQGYGILPR